MSASLVTPLKAVFYSNVHQSKVIRTRPLSQFYTFVFSGFQNLFLENYIILSITKISRNTRIIKATFPTTVF